MSADGGLFSVFQGPPAARHNDGDASDEDFAAGDAEPVPLAKRQRVDETTRPRPRSFEVPVKPAGNGSTCTHDVSLPGEMAAGDFVYPPRGEENTGEAIKKNPAKSYSFELDAFQRDAVQALEVGHSVLVSAHTSAGKTAVAEYAIALALRAGQRVIYTSPIKALSNQKYRELAEEFTDVGLMTGDTTINPSASCLVMTTEILRSMIYRGSEVVRELAWVIFDEVHKMSDRERGVVWEETIVLLPEKIRFVFLSATIPNAREFAEWVSHVKGHPTHAIYTGSRPVPLQHYIYPEGADGIFLVVDDEGTFRDENFGKAVGHLTPSTPGQPRPRKTGAMKEKGPSSCYKVVKMIMDKGYAPVIIFGFSRRDIEAMAVQMSKLDFNSDDEKDLVEQVFQNAIESLAVEDQQLPQITHALPLLKRGVGIHHSGLLPILKEIVEILFAEGLIKALFATETFSMGLNMPAKTVVFTTLRKYDAEGYRYVLGGEYIQMSGRAGRRGLDKRGLVILMFDEKLEPDTAKEILKGQADPLRSTFRLKYNMLLNLLRSEEADPEFVIKRSFAQFQADGALPENEVKLASLEEKRDSLVLPPETPSGIDEQTVLDDIQARSKLDVMRRKMRKYVSAPGNAVRFLQPGRVARVRDENTGENYGWGAVIKHTKQSKDGFGRRGGAAAKERHVVDMLLLCVPQEQMSSGSKGQVQKRPRPVQQNDDESDASWVIVPCTLETIEAISAIRIHLPTDLRPVENRSAVGRSLSKVFEKFPDSSIPLLDPIEDQGITEPAFLKLYRKVEAKTLVISGPDSLEVKCKEAGIDRSVLVALLEEKLAVGEDISAVKRAVQLGRGLILTEELKAMKRVLRRLGFINSENIVELKGRTACEINTADELVVTELMFNGSFNEMEPAVLVALLSCFVYDERADEEVILPPALDGAKTLLQDIARRVATVTQESKLPIDVEEYVSGFEPSAMKIIHAWCTGKSFAEICEMTQMFEGSIIRVLRRLEELLRQLGMAAKAIGNSDLQEKFASCTLLLRRGVAFQASLYL